MRLAVLHCLRTPLASSGCGLRNQNGMHTSVGPPPLHLCPCARRRAAPRWAAFPLAATFCITHRCGTRRYSAVCMGILYHISMDDKHKSLFTYTSAIRLIFARLAAAADLRLEPELIALAVNLTQNNRCAAALCEGSNFDTLMRKAIDSEDDLLFKVMRNCSQVRALIARCLSCTRMRTNNGVASEPAQPAELRRAPLPAPQLTCVVAVRRFCASLPSAVSVRRCARAPLPSPALHANQQDGLESKRRNAPHVRAMHAAWSSPHLPRMVLTMTEP